MKDIEKHWEKVYQKQDDQKVSWYQENPETSLNLIKHYTSETKDSIIDVGGGNSYLALKLVNEGHKNIYVLDISNEALQINKSRFKDPGEVTWLVDNVLNIELPDTFSIWHDRAVFHFLTDKNDVDRYKAKVLETLKKQGILILGTFSMSGPDACSGLPISQYDQRKVSDLFEPEFEMLDCFEEIHTTPTGNPQSFTWSVFRKV